MESNQPSPQSRSFARMASFYALLGIIVLIGVLFFRVMSVFLLPLFLAALLVVVFEPVHDWFVKRLKGYRRTAAAGVTFLVVIVILFPLGWALSSAIDEGIDLAHRDWSNLRGRLTGFRQRFGLEMPVPELLERSAAAVRRARIDITSRGDLPDATSLAERLKELEGQFLLELRPGNADPAAQFPISEECKLSAQARLAAWSDAIRELQQWGQATGQQQQIRESDLQRYREIALRIDTHYRRLRQEILGGAFRSWATELANPSPQDLRGWQERTSTYLRNYLVAVTGQTTAWVGRLLFGLSIMIIAMFYFFVDGPSMVKSLMRLSPLDDRHEQKLLQEFSNVSRAVVLATLLSALIQGILAGIGYFFAGVHPLIFLTILTTITALIPFVGAAAVWVPAAVWLAFVENRQGAGIGLAVYGFLVVSMADNLIKPLVLHGQSNIHPLVGLLSVLGGVQALGPIGILVGPMLVAFMQALLVMLRQELEQ